jgi:hypothetical protein
MFQISREQFQGLNPQNSSGFPVLEMLQKYRSFFPVSPKTLQWALERNNEFQIMNIEVQK